jgi:hypothetical protein
MAPPGLQVVPAPLRPRRPGPNAGVLVAAGLGLFLVVAAAKPWSGPDTPSASPSRPPAASTATRLETPPVDVQAGLPVANVAAPATAVDPIAGRGDWDAVSSIVHEVAFDGGRWGIAAASWTGTLSQWVDWRALRARPGVAPAAGDRTLASSACRAGSLRSSARIVAISGPARLVDAAEISVWQLRRTPFAMDEEVVVDRVPDAPGVAFLVLRSGRPWPDAAYRVLVRTGGETVGLDVCVGSVPGSGRPLPSARRS